MVSVKREETENDMTVGDQNMRLDTTSTADEGHSDASPVTDKAHPTLLGMPREIRDMVWDYAIAGHEITPRAISRTKICIKASVYNQPGETVRQWQKLNSLSLVNRQIREETKLLPYSLSVINSVCDRELEQWLSALQEEQRDAIRTISLGHKNKWRVLDHKSIYPDFGRAGKDEMFKLKNLATVIVRDTLYLRQHANYQQAALNTDVKFLRLDAHGVETTKESNKVARRQEEDLSLHLPVATRGIEQNRTSVRDPTI